MLKDDNDGGSNLLFAADLDGSACPHHVKQLDVLIPQLIKRYDQQLDL
jgi:hypothetical protein